MKIDLNSLIPKSNPEPTPEQVAPFATKAELLFARCGIKETAVTKRVVSIFGRILFDLGDSDLAVWRNGKPVFETEFAESTQGILLCGSVGTGKTTILRCMSAALNAEYLTVPDLAVIFARRGADGFWNEVNQAAGWDLFLDDLGAEQATRSYSNELPIEDLIYKRYNLWQLRGVRLHVASNLSGGQIEERYGLRIRDRLREMMKVIPCTGKSLRKQAQAP